VLQLDASLRQPQPFPSSGSLQATTLRQGAGEKGDFNPELAEKFSTSFAQNL
jgi:hypothetical protein